MSENEEKILPLLPIRNIVLFPEMELPLSIGQPYSVNAVNETFKEEVKTLIVFALKNLDSLIPTEEDLYQVGTRAVIKRMFRNDKGGMEIVLQGEERIKLEKVLHSKPYYKATYVPYPLPDDHDDRVEALHRAILDLVSKLQELVEIPSSSPVREIMQSIGGPLRQVYFLCMLINVDLKTEQGILEAAKTIEALEIMYQYLEREIRILEIKNKISTNVSSHIMKQQREHVLREQMAIIQKELGENDPYQAEIEQMRERLEQADLPQQVRNEAEREFKRMKNLPLGSADAQVIRSYMDLILELPWSKKTSDNLDLKRAKRILDEDHYDLKDVKERIIEFLAILKLNPEAKSPIVCFVGPPGVGKTSLGESIARTLERKFERISLGGLHDEAELRGHRRTYIGAMPGKIIRAIRRSGVNNPLLMLDEVDKIGKDFRGDPAAALMEIIDPSQNYSFTDNYLDLPFDLSHVFFILTANTLETISRPLLDRMEVLRLSGYTAEEKVQIAKRYLIPNRLKEAGLIQERIEFSDDAIYGIVYGYTREAGLRELDRSIARLCRKLALIKAEKSEATEEVFSVKILPENLNDFLGPQRFLMENIRKELGPGVAIGLAWTPTGGDVLYVETTLLSKGKKTLITGQLGDVMRESALAAQSYLWSHAKEIGIPEERFSDYGVHIHIPEGAIPKDGPSAGVTLTSALASLLTGLPVRSDTAMTGEITLTGLVLPIGGIKEKSLAAQQAGIKRIILPKDNHKDLADLPPSLLKDIEFIEVENLQQVLTEAIPGIQFYSEAVPRPQSQPQMQIQKEKDIIL